MTAPASTTPTNEEYNLSRHEEAHEVGLMFVHEYYTYLNKEPSRLHCFYNKQSTMSHGVQGATIKLLHGQQDIHTKIVDLDFDDCKVLVSSVDSQSSANGGILIQVLGEMSNRGGPSQKFAQTFFLAEQPKPKGYYVLNDIFLYLKDDSEVDQDEIEHEFEEYRAEKTEQEYLAEQAENEFEDFLANEEAKHESEPAVAAEPAPVVVEEKVKPVVEDKKKVPVPVEPVKVEAEQEKKAPVPAEEKKPAEKKTEKKHDKKTEKKEVKKDDSKKEVKKDSEATEAPKKQPAQESTPAQATTVAQAESSPAPASTTPAPAVAAPVVPAQPPKPAAPKTWANLAANNSNQWGSHVAAAKASSVTVSQAPAKPQTPAQTVPAAQNQGPVKPHQRPNGREEYHSIYIKNITEKITLDQLREAFSKFGPVKHLELTQKKNCAYLDFANVEGMQSALKQHTVQVGSEIVLAEERRRNGPQFGGRPFGHHNGNGPNSRFEQKPTGQNGHQAPQGGHRGGRTNSVRGGAPDRKPLQSRPEKAASPVAVK